VLGLLFNLENEGDMFLQTVRLSPNCIVLWPRRPFTVTTERTLNTTLNVLTDIQKTFWQVPILQ
jgi:hypothetical protein